MEELISVIVPVYNVKNYLNRCVKSVLNQTYSNLEIILVDDGSSDGSEVLCDDLAKADSRIMVIHKPNGGAADAKNIGTAAANGSWIIYVDSDDWIHPHLIEILVNTVIENGTEIALCNFNKYTHYAPLDFDVKENLNIEILSSKEALRKLYTNDAFITPWAILLRRELALRYPYPKGRIHEDDATTYKYFSDSTTVSWIDEPLYAYFVRDDSVMGQSFSLKKIDCLTAIRERIEFFDDRKDNEMVRLAMRRYVKLALWVIDNIQTLPNGKQYADREIRFLKIFVNRYKSVADLSFREYSYLYKFIDNSLVYYIKKICCRLKFDV